MGWAMSHDLFRPFLSDAEQRCYAAIVVVDGTSEPWRLPNQLGYGVPVVFLRNRVSSADNIYPAPVVDEFFYPELRPGEDYIAADTNNLEAVLESLLAAGD